MIRRPPRSTLSSSSAASDVYKRQLDDFPGGLAGANGRGHLKALGAQVTFQPVKFVGRFAGLILADDAGGRVATAGRDMHQDEIAAVAARQHRGAFNDFGGLLGEIDGDEDRAHPPVITGCLLYTS